VGWKVERLSVETFQVLGSGNRGRIGLLCSVSVGYTHIYTQSGPKKCIHSLLINIFGINLNEISISG